MLFNISSLIVDILLEECQCNEWSPQRRCTEVSNCFNECFYFQSTPMDCSFELFPCLMSVHGFPKVVFLKHLIEWYKNVVSRLLLRTVFFVRPFHFNDNSRIHTTKKTRTSRQRYLCLKSCIVYENLGKGLQHGKSVLADFNNSDFLVELNECMIAFLHYCKIFSFLNAFLENQEKTPDIWCFASA